MYLYLLAKIAVELLLLQKIGGVLGKPQGEIVDSGASWRSFFHAALSPKALTAIFCFLAHNQGIYRCIPRRSFFSLELGQTLTKFSAF